MEDSERSAALERLDAMERGIMAAEGERARGGDPAPTVHLLFREAHNLKSFLSMGGFKASSSLMHEAESLLDDIRSGRRDFSARSADLVLAAADAVRRSVLEGMEDEEGLSAVAAGLKNEHPEPKPGPKAATRHAAADDAPPPVDRSSRFRLSGVERAALAKALSAGLALYVADKALGNDFNPDSAAELPVFDALAGLGSVIAYRTLKAGDREGLLSVLFASARTRDEISDELFDPFYPVLPPLSGNGSGQDGGDGAPKGSASAECAESEDGMASGTEVLRPRRSATLPRILIVDDEATSLFLLQSAASAFGRVSTATTGREAVTVFEAAFDADPFEIAILDLLLPDSTGFEILERMREREREDGIRPGEGLKVIIASALNDYESVGGSFRRGADAYVTKPFSMGKLDEAFSRLGYKRLVPEGGAAPNTAPRR